MAARKGHKKAGGRKKGTPNKATASVKAALVEAFDELGGVPALVRFGKKNPAAFYALWAKMLPTEVKLAGETAIRILSDDDFWGNRDRLASAEAARAPAPGLPESSPLQGG